jgi:hypothetical protein
LTELVGVNGFHDGHCDDKCTDDDNSPHHELRLDQEAETHHRLHRGRVRRGHRATVLDVAKAELLHVERLKAPLHHEWPWIGSRCHDAAPLVVPGQRHSPPKIGEREVRGR